MPNQTPIASGKTNKYEWPTHRAQRLVAAENRANHLEHTVAARVAKLALLFARFLGQRLVDRVHLYGENAEKFACQRRQRLARRQALRVRQLPNVLTDRDPGARASATEKKSNTSRDREPFKHNRIATHSPRTKSPWCSAPLSAAANEENKSETLKREYSHFHALTTTKQLRAPDSGAKCTAARAETPATPRAMSGTRRYEIQELSATTMSAQLPAHDTSRRLTARTCNIHGM